MIASRGVVLEYGVKAWPTLYPSAGVNAGKLGPTVGVSVPGYKLAEIGSCALGKSANLVALTGESDPLDGEERDLGSLFRGRGRGLELITRLLGRSMLGLESALRSLLRLGTFGAGRRHSSGSFFASIAANTRLA